MAVIPASYRNLATGQQRRLAAGPGARPRLSGDRLCYEYQGRIRVHTLGTGRDQVVSPAGASASACDIAGSIVVLQALATATTPTSTSTTSTATGNPG